MLLDRFACNAAKLGLLLSTASSIGGSMTVCCVVLIDKAVR